MDLIIIHHQGKKLQVDLPVLPENGYIFGMPQLDVIAMIDTTFTFRAGRP